MDCAASKWSSSHEFMRELQRRAREERLPLSGSLELTNRCNLDCVHCYLGPQAEQRRLSHLEMSTSQVISILDQAVENGCLELLLTGGEPMIRPDFPEVYRHAVESGLLVTVFSNGTLVTDGVVALLTDLPPRCVEVTVYGGTPATHDAVTTVEGSFDRAMAGIRRLLSHGVRVKLKTILMSVNEHEFNAMRALARALGVEFRSDPALFPRFNGDRSPLSLRVAPADVVAKELADPDELHRWRAFYESSKEAPSSDALYQCGAGLTSFHIDARGTLHPCLMARRYAYDLLTGSFADGWRGPMPRIRERKASSGYECNRCGFRALCSSCPAFFASETGDEERRSQYLCSLGHYRFETIVGYCPPTEGP